MALQGTLDTFALPDVLRLLASTKKSGRLLVQGDRGSGSLWLHDGAVVEGEASMAATDTTTDVLFELLRLDDGSFLFDPDDQAANPGDSADVESLITDSQQLHDEWHDLSQTVPSLDVGVTLVDELPDDETVITRERWRHLVAIGHGTTVRQLGEALSLRELPVLRAAAGLHADGLIAISHDTPGSTGAQDTDSGLPTLGDGPDEGDLFGSDDVQDDLPEPLPGDGDDGEAAADPFGEAVAGPRADDGEPAGGAMVRTPVWSEADADERAALEREWAQLSDDERLVLVAAADRSDPQAIEEALAVVPDGDIDRDLLRRFLSSVRN